MTPHVSAPQQWATIAELFDRLVLLPSEATDAFIASACGDDADLAAELRRLLVAHKRSGALDDLSDRLAGDLEKALPHAVESDSHVGPYRVLETLGSGGQGVVFLAVREGEGFQQRVAVKVLRASAFGDRSALVRRFLGERGILARLEHPNIPRFLDGGLTAEGEPYFAMEYVRGTPIDRYCNVDHKLSMRQRLSLFASVCDAVQYAHRHLVVHRDLKPSNILITDDGVVKVLDFGIAKLLDAPHEQIGITGAGQRWMTPDYASPEQVRGDPVTTAADVFALGVILYELLACTRPHTGRTMHDVERAILEIDPVRPSVACACDDAACQRRGMSAARLQKELAGDLDTIALKALNKAPERRYATAGALADEIRRYLAGLPVHARADSLGYRARKFVMRHRLLVMALVLAAVSVLTGAVAVGLATRRVMRSAEVAELERQRAEEVSRFAVGLFRSADPLATRTTEATARELLDSGAARIRRELADQPGRRASMLEVLAQSYAGLGRHAEAHAAAAEAVGLRRAEQPANPRAIATALELTARSLMARGIPDSAGIAVREAMSLRRASGATGPELAATLGVLGDYFHMVVAIDSAEYYWREAAAKWPPAVDSVAQADVLINLANVLRGEGKFGERESLLVKAFEIRTAVFPPGHPKVSAALSLLASTRYVLGNVSQARGDFQRVYDMSSRALGPKHPDVANALQNLAIMTESEGELDSAVVLHTQAAVIKREALGANHSSFARTLSVLGALQVRRRDLAAADTLVTRSLAIRRAALGDEHVDVAWDRSLLGVVYRERGRTREAEALQRRALEVVSKLDPGHLHLVRTQIDLAGTLTAQRRFVEAESLLVRARASLVGLSVRYAHQKLREADSMLAVLRARRQP